MNIDEEIKKLEDELNNLSDNKSILLFGSISIVAYLLVINQISNEEYKNIFYSVGLVIYSYILYKAYKKRKINEKRRKEIKEELIYLKEELLKEKNKKTLKR